MPEQDNVTTIKPDASQAAGAAANAAGPIPSEQPALPATDEPQAAISSAFPEISNADRIATLERAFAVMAGVIEQGKAGTVPVQIAVQENGQRVDRTVQVPVGEYLIGLSGKVGYAHRVRTVETS